MYFLNSNPIKHLIPHDQDLAVYKIIGEMANLEIAEMCARSGANCGSIFLDLRFRELVKTLLAEHPAHLDAPSLAYFMHSFSETDKLAFMGESDDRTSGNFHLYCGIKELTPLKIPCSISLPSTSKTLMILLSVLSTANWLFQETFCVERCSIQ